MATPAAPPTEPPPTIAPVTTDKAPRLTAKQIEALTELSDGRVRKATTRTNPTTDEVNGTTAGSLVPYGYVEGQAVPGATMYKITTKGLEFLRTYADKKAALEAKKSEAPAATSQG